MKIAILVSLLAIVSLQANAATAVGVDASLWGSSDATLGVAGFTLENFEDVALASGLAVQVISPSLGSYGPVATLPFLFNTSLDCCGAFSASLMWDGTHSLVNRTFVPITTYANDGGWSDVYFLFSGGVKSVGFSIAQAEGTIGISLDFGSGFVFFDNSTTYLGAGGGRNGYLRIDAGVSETIFGVKLDNGAGNGDGILYDHLAFNAVPGPGGEVPEPSTMALLGSGLAIGALVFARRK